MTARRNRATPWPCRSSTSTRRLALPTPPAPPPRPADAAAGQTCPNCGLANLPDALFCEACGYDFTTGSMPRTETPAAKDKDKRRRQVQGRLHDAAREQRSAARRQLGRGALDRPAVVRRAGEPRPAPVGRPARRRTPAAHLAARRPRVPQPRHPSRHRLRRRQRRQPPARPADHRRLPVVGRGPRLVQRHLRRRRRRPAAQDRDRRRRQALRSVPRTASTSARGPGW